MATITIEMAIAPWLRDGGASWLVDQRIHRFSATGKSEEGGQTAVIFAEAVFLLCHNRVPLA
jgi:hypothetical protein